MMNKKRLFVGALALALSMTGLSSAQDRVVLRVWTGSSSPVENEFKEKQIAAFEAANPNIDVDLLISPDYGTQIRAAFASGDYPEVFTVGQFDFPQWQADGLLAIGTDKIEDAEGIYEGLRAAFTADGELYCAPKDFSTLALLYNIDAFEAAGLALPDETWTWEDMAAAAEALTKDGMVGFSAAADKFRWMAFFYANGAQLFDDEGKVAFDSPEAIEALEFYQSFVANGHGKLPSDLNSGWNGEAFGKGAAAMTIEGNWAIGYLRDTYPQLNWGVTEIPLAPNGGRGTLTFTECWAVSSRAQGALADAAWKLVNFLTGPNDDGAKAVAEAGFGVMPARAEFGDLWLSTVGEEYSAFVKGAEYAVAPIFPLGFADFDAAVNEATTLVMTLEESAEDALREAADVARDINGE
ncbi:MAG: extracellular solute-binding protein [Anaerolineae bacterium]|nr:extracellular solute-binding protein [Anaerolineae bacterium]MDW8171662.1 extracellular solute-binding protein [Anaerolineae bacterium]